MNLLMGNSSKGSTLPEQPVNPGAPTPGFDMTSMIGAEPPKTENKLRFTQNPQSFDLMSLFNR